MRHDTSEISARERTAARFGEIQAKNLLEKIRLPEVPSDVIAILAKQITDVVADTETKVRQQIAQHQMGHQGETWLSQRKYRWERT